MKWIDTFQRGSKKIFLVISLYPFLYILDMKNYKLSLFKMCFQVDPFHTTIFYIYYFRTTIQNFSKIYLGQLYKIVLGQLYKNYNPLV